MTIANGWPLVPLSEIATPVQRSVPVVPGKSYRTLGVKWWGEGAYERQTIDGSQTAVSALNEVLENDLIINKIWVRHGSVAVVTSEVAGCVGSNEFPTFEFRHDRVLPRWLHWYSKTQELWKKCDALSQGSSGKNRIRPERFLTIDVPLPPLTEQRRIIAKVDRLAAKIDAVRELRKEATTELKILRRTIYLKVDQLASVTGTKQRLSDIIASHDSGWSPKCDDQPAGANAWAVLKTTSVQWEGFAATANKTLLPSQRPKPKVVVQHGDVLITRAGPMNRVGVACVVHEPPPKLMLSDKIVRVIPKHGVCPEFLTLMLGTPSAQEYFRQGKTGLAESQVNISRSKLLSLELFVPPISEQRRIVVYAQGLKTKLDSVESTQTQSVAEKNALLPSILDRAFRGEL